MAEDPLDPELIRSIESLASNLGFTLIDRVSKEALTLRCSPPQPNRERVEQALLSVINRFGMVAKFEWTESNYQRLSVFLFTPTEYELLLKENERLGERLREDIRSHPDRRDLVSIIVRGTIGATIGGRPRIYPNPDHEEVYVTLEGGNAEYIECDATELPQGIQLYFGFPVMVDKGKRVIVGPIQPE